MARCVLYNRSVNAIIVNQPFLGNQRVSPDNLLLQVKAEPLDTVNDDHEANASTASTEFNVNGNQKSSSSTAPVKSTDSLHDKENAFAGDTRDTEENGETNDFEEKRFRKRNRSPVESGTPSKRNKTETTGTREIAPGEDKRKGQKRKKRNIESPDKKTAAYSTSCRIEEVAANARDSNDALFECDICSVTFGTSQQLQDHKSMYAYMPSKYECRACPTRFNLRAFLMEHARCFHANIPQSDYRKLKIACIVCRKAFFSKLALQAHIFHNNHEDVGEHNAEELREESVASVASASTLSTDTANVDWEKATEKPDRPERDSFSTPSKKMRQMMLTDYFPISPTSVKAEPISPAKITNFRKSSSSGSEPTIVYTTALVHRSATPDQDRIVSSTPMTRSTPQGRIRSRSRMSRRRLTSFSKTPKTGLNEPTMKRKIVDSDSEMIVAGIETVPKAASASGKDCSVESAMTVTPRVSTVKTTNSRKDIESQGRTPPRKCRVGRASKKMIEERLRMCFMCKDLTISLTRCDARGSIVNVTPDLTVSDISVRNRDKSNVAEPNVNASDVAEPNVNASDVAEPNVNASDVAEPNVNASDVAEPNVNASNVTEPNTNVSNVMESNVNTADVAIPNIRATNITQPNINTPEVTQSNKNIPDTIQPKTNTSSVTKIDIDTSNVDVPNVSTLDVITTVTTQSDVIQPDSTQLNTKASDTAQPNVSAPGTGKSDRSSRDRRSPDRSSRDRRSPDRRSPDRSSPDRGSPDRRSPDRSSPDRNSPDRISPDRSLPERTVPYIGEPSVPNTSTSEVIVPDTTASDVTARSSEGSEIVDPSAVAQLPSSPQKTSSSVRKEGVVLKSLRVCIEKLSPAELSKHSEKYRSSETEQKSNNLYKCKICDMEFNRKRNRRKHVKQAHTAYMSVLCKSRTDDKAKLVAHYLQDHSSSVRTECCVCQQNFPSRLDLKRHLLVHCIRIQTTQRGALLSYAEMRCDGSVKKYKCTACGKIFKMFSSLKEHRSTCALWKKMTENNGFSLVTTPTKVGRVRLNRTNKTVPSVTDAADQSGSQPSSEKGTDGACVEKETAGKKKTSTSPPLPDNREVDAESRPSTSSNSPEKILDVEAVGDLGISNNGDLNVPYSCAICGLQFQTMKNLWTHKRTFWSMPTDLCNICGTAFPSKRFLRMHMTNTHMGQASSDYCLHCRYCGQSFVKRATLRMHEAHFHSAEQAGSAIAGSTSDRSNVPNFSTMCTTCHIIFTDYDRLVEHNTYYYGGHVYPCTFCDQSFQGMYLLHHHNKMAHYPKDVESSYEFRCDICNEGFKNESHYFAHKAHVHWINSVPLANDENRQKSNNANGRRACACPTCHLYFTTREDLLSHEAEFSNQGSFACDKCERQCHTLEALITHRSLTHDDGGGTRYRCPTCNEGQPTEDKLLRHQKHFHQNTVEQMNRLRKHSQQLFEMINAPSLEPQERQDQVSAVAPEVPADGSVRKPMISVKRIEELTGSAPLEKDLSVVENGEQDVVADAVKTPSKIKLVQCTVCNALFNSLKSYRRHRLQYARTGNFQCDLCPRQFLLQSTQKEHMAKHNVNTHWQHICPVCNGGFKNARLMSMHILHLHPTVDNQSNQGDVQNLHNIEYISPSSDSAEDRPCDITFVAPETENQSNLSQEVLGDGTLQLATDPLIIDEQNNDKNTERNFADSNAINHNANDNNATGHSATNAKTIGRKSSVLETADHRAADTKTSKFKNTVDNIVSQDAADKQDAINKPTVQETVDHTTTTSKTIKYRSTDYKSTAPKKVHQQTVTQEAADQNFALQKTIDHGAAMLRLFLSTDQQAAAQKIFNKRNTDHNTVGGKVPNQNVQNITQKFVVLSTKIVDQSVVNQKATVLKIIDQKAGNLKSINQNVIDQNAAVQKPLDQETAVQKAVDQQSAVQKVVYQQTAVQKAVDQQSAVTKVVAQEATVQKAVDQMIAVQKVAVQKVVYQQTAVQKAVDQKTAVQKAFDQKAAVQNAIDHRAAVQKIVDQKTAVHNIALQKIVDQKTAVHNIALQKTTDQKTAAQRIANQRNTDHNATDGKIVDQKTVVSKIALQKTTDQKVGAPKATNQKNTGHNSVDEKIVDQNDANQKATVQKAAEQKTTIQKVFLQKITDHETAAQKIISQRNTDHNIMDGNIVDQNTANQKATAQKIIGQKSVNPKAINQKVVHQKPAVQKAVDQKAAVQKPAVEKAVDQKAAVQKPAVQKAAVQKPAVQKPGVQQAVNQKAAVQKPAVQKAVDQKAAVQKAVDQKAVDQKAVDQKAVDQKAVDQKPVDQKPVDQKAVDQKAVDQKAVDQKAVDQKAVDQKAVDQKAVNQKVAVQKAVDQKAVVQNAIDHKTVVQKTVDQKAAVQNIAVQKTTDQKTAAQRIVNQRNTDHNATGGKIVDQKAVVPKIALQNTTDQKVGAPKATNQKNTGHNSVDEKIVNQNDSNQKATVQKAIDQKAATQKIVLQGITERKSPAQKSTDHNTVDQKIVDQKIANQTTAAQEATVEKTSHQKTADDKTDHCRTTVPKRSNYNNTDQKTINQRTAAQKSTSSKTIDQSLMSPKATDSKTTQTITCKKAFDPKTSDSNAKNPQSTYNSSSIQPKDIPLICIDDSDDEVEEPSTSVATASLKKESTLPTDVPTELLELSCGFCPAKYQNLTELQTHLAVQHRDSNKQIVPLGETCVPAQCIPCVLCNSKFSTQPAFKKHLLTVHLPSIRIMSNDPTASSSARVVYRLQKTSTAISYIPTANNASTSSTTPNAVTPASCEKLAIFNTDKGTRIARLKVRSIVDITANIAKDKNSPLPPVGKNKIIRLLKINNTNNTCISGQHLRITNSVNATPQK